MAKQDIQTIIGSSISKDETLLKNFKSIKSCFAGWVESYNEKSGTVNVQPAIQDYIPNDEQSGNNYRNSPLLVNVWVLGTFKSTAIEKGDKAVCFVLDQKANDFFKSIYDSGISLAFQTFKPKTSAQKSVCDCVCIILGDASFQELYEAVSAIDTALENKADIDGTYPDMTVGNATNATNDANGNNIANTYLPINNKSLPSLSNNYVSQSTLKELCDSFNLKYGESTTLLYFESGTNYSNIQGLIQPSGVTYKQYNFLQVTRQAGSMYMITVYAGYNAQVQMTIPPQFFFVSSSGISPVLTTVNYLKVDPTKLTPSTANGWSGGTSSSIPSTAGAYWVKVDNQPITLIAYYVGGDWVSGTTIWYKQA